MDDGHDDGHDDGAESIGSRVTLWLILHAFILSKSILASETLFEIKIRAPTGGCPPYWDKILWRAPKSHSFGKERLASGVRLPCNRATMMNSSPPSTTSLMSFTEAPF
jgi:hypothetical protein